MPNQSALHRTSNALLQRLLEEPALDHWVRELPGPEWKALVQHVGLEDSAELLALSTPEQLVELIDETLWPGGTTETFDLERFATLLDVLHDAGTRELAEKVAALPEELLTFALSKLLSIWPSEFLRQLAEADESGALDKRLECQMSDEIDEYTILSPSGLAWDPLVALLRTWSDSQPELLARILERLTAANVNGIAEPDELVNVLDELSELEEEAQAEREERRARSGYVSGSDARAFLRLPPCTRPGETDAIGAAYFRRLRREPAPPQRAGDHRLQELLRSYARSERIDSKRSLGSGPGLLKLALDELAMGAPERHARALEELAFLTNVMVAHLTDSKGPAAGPPAGDAIRYVVSTLEDVGAGPSRSDPKTAAKSIYAALVALGPIGMFRNRSR
jgi:hypothetical protein